MIRKYYLLLLLISSAITFTACSNDDSNGGKFSEDGPNVNKNVVTDDEAVTRLEFPRLKDDGNSVVIVYRTSNKTYDPDRVNYAVEWDCEKKSQRWSCYQMHKGYSGTYSRVTNNYMNDTQNLPKGSYWENDYYEYPPYEHGHICPNADRKYSYDANFQTFYLTNMQPQYHKFNGFTDENNKRREGLWYRMEEKVRDWSPQNSTDTMYVCKGGTIDREDQIIERVSGKLIVPKYFFMACLMKNSQGYRAVGFWAEQKSNEWRDDQPLSDFAVTIDELEELTGIDFFCNLPDDIENYVENHFSTKAWGLD